MMKIVATCNFCGKKQEKQWDDRETALPDVLYDHQGAVSFYISASLTFGLHLLPKTKKKRGQVSLMPVPNVF